MMQVKSIRRKRWLFCTSNGAGPGSVCLVHRGKFIWISGDVEKREMD